MISKTLLVSSLLSLAAPAPAADKDLPVLFLFKQPTHNVAVFRGADLKNAIASGLVKGFGSGSGADLGDGGEARRGKSVVVAPAVAPIRVAPAPVVVRPAPVVTRVVKPVVVKTAPVVSYAPKPAYKPYVDPYADEPAYYTYEYAVNDDYSKSAFDANESRDNYLTTGKYSVALPDARIQTVTYTVDGGAGYVADVTYSGQAVYPPAPAPGYSA